MTNPTRREDAAIKYGISRCYDETPDMAANPWFVEARMGFIAGWDACAAELGEENARLREGLGVAQERIHDEFCSEAHHSFCTEARAALARKGER